MRELRLTTGMRPVINRTSPFAEQSGLSLMGMFRTDHIYERIFPSLASLSHIDAVEKILRTSATLRGFRIWEIPCFWSIGNELRKNLAEQVNCLLIQAPHTHWDITNPIIYSFDAAADQYLVESTPPSLGKSYKPVSFVWSGMEILPYEWVDPSVNLDVAELVNAYNAIRMIFRIVDHYRFPIGLGVSFRFKEHLSDVPVESLEMPLDSTLLSGDKKVSKIIRGRSLDESKLTANENGSIERVAASRPRVDGPPGCRRATPTVLRSNLTCTPGAPRPDYAGLGLGCGDV